MVRILNASYSPNFNPIEGVIGLIKNNIKRQRVNAIAQGHFIDLREAIENIGGNIEKEVCVSYINKSNLLLNSLK